MDKRKSGDASLAQRRKKAKANDASGRIPITAFFERMPRPSPEQDVPTAIDQVEEIDNDEPIDATSSTNSPEARMVQDTINFAPAEPEKPKVKRTVTGFHLLRSREVRGGLPRRHKQHVVRDVLQSYAPLGVSPLPDLQSSQWITCMQFDTDGVLLAIASSNGTIALYDFDEYFHSLLVFRNQQAKHLHQAPPDGVRAAPATIRPIHALQTNREIKRIRWNPMDQDILACSFTARNEIYLYNLKKFPTQPFRILKAPTRPTTGYYDFLFTKSRIGAPSIIAGDVDGSIRLWDLHVPSKPVWVVVNSRDVGCITSMCVCANHQYLICGTDQGWILIYDTWNIVVPAFGQRPVPKRFAMFDLLVHVRGTKSVLHDLNVETGGGVVSVQLVPHTHATIVCQLLNDWIVVVDALRQRVVQLHPVLRRPRNIGLTSSDPITLTSDDPWSSSNVLGTRTEASYLRLHRCMGSFVFDGAMFATGFASDNGLYAIDMHSQPTSSKTPSKADAGGSVHLLRRLRTPMERMVTAVAAHPGSHVIVCGMQSNAIEVVGSVDLDPAAPV